MKINFIDDFVDEIPGKPFFAKIGFPGPFPKKLLFGRHFYALQAQKCLPIPYF
jgi:hypothetical protein